MIRVFHDNRLAVTTVADNAGGIDADVLPKVFDPYFTTKEPGKGTGIGLYMSKVIVEKNMDGRLTAKNVPDGVEFRIEMLSCGHIGRVPYT
jgi:C4-dicarboxylate-specific signal transduction histidine kinase